MLNSISVVGRIVKTVYHIHDKAYIDIEVKKPFPLEIGYESWDVFSVQLWKGLESMMEDVGEIGMLLAIRGRLVINEENDEHAILKNTVIYAELIETLNKYFYK